MRSILLYFWRLCLIKGSPQSLPSTKELLYLTIAIYLLVSIAAATIFQSERSLLQAVAMVITNLTMATCGILLFLYYKKVEHRFISTLIALLGCGILLTFVTLPFDLLFYGLDGNGQESNSLAVSISILIICWWLAITANILSHAGNISFFQGFALALTMEVLYAMVITSMFPSIIQS